MSIALKSYFHDRGRFPHSINDLVPDYLEMAEFKDAWGAGKQYDSTSDILVTGIVCKHATSGIEFVYTITRDLKVETRFK